MTDPRTFAAGRVGGSPPPEMIHVPAVPWMEQAACIGDDTDPIPTNKDAYVAYVARNCVRCPVLEQCGQWAADTRQERGVWGGSVIYNGTARNPYMRSLFDNSRSKCGHDPRHQVMRIGLKKPNGSTKIRDIKISCHQCERDELAVKRANRLADQLWEGALRDAR